MRHGIGREHVVAKHGFSKARDLAVLVNHFELTSNKFSDLESYRICADIYCRKDGHRSRDITWIQAAREELRPVRARFGSFFGTRAAGASNFLSHLETARKDSRYLLCVYSNSFACRAESPRTLWASSDNVR